MRLQCYEGLDAAQALYDWDFPRQILHLRAAEAAATAAATATGAPVDAAAIEAGLYDRRFLIARPLLQALEQSPCVLLVDEVDRADDEFEAFLLEVLADAAITVPELGRIAAETPPLTVLTSNRTREVHDALKRRCLYHWVEHPGFDREVAILRQRLPEVTERLAAQVATAAGRMRELDLIKPPGVAESIDWAGALVALGARALDPDLAAATLGAVLKYREDVDPGPGHRPRQPGRQPAMTRGGGLDVDRAAGRVRADAAARRRRRRRPTGCRRCCARSTPWAPSHRTASTGPAGRRSAPSPTTWRSTTPRSSRTSAATGRPARPIVNPAPTLPSIAAPYTAGPPGESADDDESQILGLSASTVEILRQRDFALLTPRERDEVRRLLALLGPRTATRRSRRRRPARRRRGRSRPARCAPRCGTPASRPGWPGGGAASAHGASCCCSTCPAR